MKKQEAWTPPKGALTQEHTLPNGRRVLLVMPDMLAFASGDIDIPNVTQADVYELVYGGSATVDPIQALNSNRRRARGLYALAALVMIDPATGDPALCLDDEERQPTQLAPREIPWGDLELVYTFFRFGPAFAPATDQGQTSPDQPTQSSDDVPSSAE